MPTTKYHKTIYKLVLDTISNELQYTTDHENLQNTEIEILRVFCDKLVTRFANSFNSDNPLFNHYRFTEYWEANK